MTRIKICGLSRPCDIEAVNIARPDYAGFVFAKSRRRVSPAQARVLRKALMPDIVSVGVFVNAEQSDIIALVRQGVIEAIQLHGNEEEDYIMALQSQIDLPIIKALSVTEASGTPRGTVADFWLFDHQGGGTGQCFNWDLIGETKKPFFLAGGLNAGNLRDAIRRVNPYAVDVSSGVETDGYKDAEKILAAVSIVRESGRISGQTD